MIGVQLNEKFAAFFRNIKDRGRGELGVGKIVA